MATSKERSSKFNKAVLAERRVKKIKRGVTLKTFEVFGDDDIIDSDVAQGVTSALFTNDSDSTLTAFYTSSTVTAAGSDYFLNVYSADPQLTSSAVPQFAIAVGDSRGYGTVTSSGASTASMTPSKAVYTQFANLLLDAGDDKFTIDGIDQDTMVFFTMNRARFKEKMNPAGWELWLKESTLRKYVDDSASTPATSKNGKKVYNVVINGTTTKQGLFYPELGIIAFGATHNVSGSIDHADGIGTGSFSTIAVDTDSNLIADVWTAMTTASANYFKGRAEEDITSTHYFCRVKNSDYNFSNNPTFVTSSARLKHSEMIKNPQVYITTVGLYSEDNELLAVAKLSKPLLKNFTREATIRVKLDY